LFSLKSLEMDVHDTHSEITQQFTGKERDAETGLDYFGFRYYSAPQGRWTSPDSPFVDQHPGNPQSWNLYLYVLNNPLKLTDPTGLKVLIDVKWSRTGPGGQPAISPQVWGDFLDATLEWLNSRQSKQLTITIDNNGYLGVVVPPGLILNEREQKLVDMINDQNHTAILKLHPNSPQIFFGAWHMYAIARGTNWLDMGDV
jgi:RHS repeat-associated protein